MTERELIEIFMNLEGAELDAFLREIGMDPDELLAQFDRVMASVTLSALTSHDAKPDLASDVGGAQGD